MAEDIQEIVKSQKLPAKLSALLHLDIQCPNARRGTCMDDSTNLYGAVQQRFGLLDSNRKKKVFLPTILWSLQMSIDRAGLAKLSDVPKKKLKSFASWKSTYLHVGLGKKINAAAFSIYRKIWLLFCWKCQTTDCEVFRSRQSHSQYQRKFLWYQILFSPKRPGQQKETLFLFSKLDKAH